MPTPVHADRVAAEIKRVYTHEARVLRGSLVAAARLEVRP